MAPATIPASTIAAFIDRLYPAYCEGDSDADNKAMELANIRQLEEQYRAIARGDFGPVLASLADDIEMDYLGAPGMPFVGRFKGRDQAAAAIAHNFSQIDEPETEILSVVAQGDTVVLMARERGQLRTTGRTYEIHWTQTFTFRDGKIVRFRGMYDNAGMLAAMPLETVTSLVASWQSGNVPGQQPAS